MLPVDLAVRIKDSTAAINLMDLRLRALKDNINLDATMRQGCVESGHGIDAWDRGSAWCIGSKDMHRATQNLGDDE